LDGKVTVIECPRRLDASIADDFKAKMNELVEQGNYQIVIDLQQTEFMDSSGLGSLVSRIAVTRSNQGDVRLASPSPFIRNLLEVTHLDKVFKCFDDIESAVDSFK
jgi:anti-sigma B factor antagonist